MNLSILSIRGHHGDESIVPTGIILKEKVKGEQRLKKIDLPSSSEFGYSGRILSAIKGVREVRDGVANSGETEPCPPPFINCSHIAFRFGIQCLRYIEIHLYA